MISKESKQKKRMQGSQIKATVIQEVTSYGILSRYRLEIKPKIGAKKPSSNLGPGSRNTCLCWFNMSRDRTFGRQLIQFRVLSASRGLHKCRCG